jgi:tetratricopeptide (TPR) repeat protein
MQALFSKIWELLLPIPMPWQIVLAFLLVMPLAPLLVLRCLPWLLVKLLQVLLALTEFIAQVLCFLEYQITKSIRKNKRTPPEILYLLTDVLANSVRATQSLKSNSERLYRTAFRIPWILRPRRWYALPLILLPVWFLRPHLGNSSFTVLIDRSVTWWCSLEHWAMTGEWTPSNLTCHYPNSPSRWDTFLKAREYELKREIREYTREIEIQPNPHTAYYKRGNAYLELENLDTAFKDYTTSVRVEPTFAPGYVGRGNVYLAKKDDSSAFKEYSDAVNADSKYAPGYVGRGNVYLTKKDDSSAFKEYSDAINADSKYAPGYVGRGDVYQIEGDKDSALQEYRKALQNDPNYALAYARIGNLYYRNFENREAAIEEYKRAADLFLKIGEIRSYNEVFKILNELKKYTIYKVKRGDSLMQISRKYDVPLEIIISANRETYPTLVTNPDRIEIGWKLKVPQ